jgi:hypothetical protein
MQIPAAMFIESAAEELDGMRERHDVTLKAQRKELHVAVGDQPDEFIRGYELGLQTARVMLTMSVPAQQAGLADLL